MMSTALATPTNPPTPVRELTAQDLADLFGPIPLSRIRFDPKPGTATEQDLYDLYLRENRSFELVSGIILEKPKGFPEAFLGGVIFRLLCDWVVPRKLGFVIPADGMMRLAP